MYILIIDDVPNISPGKISPTWISAKRSTTKPLKSPFSVTFLLSVNPWSFLNSTNWCPVSVVIFVAVFFKDDLSNVFRLFNIVGFKKLESESLWASHLQWTMVKTTNLSFLNLYMNIVTYFHFANYIILFSIQKSYLKKKITRKYWRKLYSHCKNILLWIENENFWEKYLLPQRSFSTTPLFKFQWVESCIYTYGSTCYGRNQCK